MLAVANRILRMPRLLMRNAVERDWRPDRPTTMAWRFGFAAMNHGWYRRFQGEADCWPIGLPRLGSCALYGTTIVGRDSGGDAAPTGTTISNGSQN